MLSTKIFSLLTLFIGCTSNSNVAADDVTGRSLIIGGEDAGPGEYPYYVQLLPDDGYTDQGCGGSLIAPDLVLSSAECMLQFSDEGCEIEFSDLAVLAVVGDHKRYDPTDSSSNNDENVQLRRCSMVTVHPQFDSEGFFYDVALCKLDEPVVVNDANVILELNTDVFFPPDQHMLTMMGFGANVTEDFLFFSVDESGDSNDGSVDESGDSNDGSVDESGDRNDGSVDEEEPPYEIGDSNDGSVDEGSVDEGSVDEEEPPCDDEEESCDSFDSVDDNDKPYTLQVATLPVLALNRCQDVFRGFLIFIGDRDFDITDLVGESHLCAWDENADVGGCFNDWGGPAVTVSTTTDGRILHTQVGINSWHFLCGLTPNGFADVAFLYPWIKATACGELGSIADFCTPSNKMPKKGTKNSKGSKSSKKS